MLKNNNVIIIGAGLGGLSAGIYLQKNGFNTTILEKNSVAGGVSYAWKRGDYLFDGSAEWLAGSAPSINMHELLKEVIDFDRLNIINHEEFIVIENNNEKLTIYRNADKLREELLRISPEDIKPITEFTDAIKKAGSFKLDYKIPPEIMNPFQMLTFPFKNFKFLLFLIKWKRISMEEFSQKFQSKTLANLIQKIFPSHQYFSIFSIIMSLGWMHRISGGYCIGGSNKITTVISDKYIKLGGKILFKKDVSEIITSNNIATGVKCLDNTEYMGDFIIPAIDSIYTHEKLLNKKFITNQKLSELKNRKLYHSLVIISLGVNKKFDLKYHNYLIQTSKKIDIGDGVLSDELMVRIGSFDPNFAPKNRTTIVSRFRVNNWRYWKKLREDNYPLYKKEKERISKEVINELEIRFGPLKESIEVIDTATPATYIRYNNIRGGSFQGWAPTPKMVGKTLKKGIKGLKNLYFTGQWVWPAGGITGVVRIGRHTAQLICKQTGTKFKF